MLDIAEFVYYQKYARVNENFIFNHHTDFIQIGAFRLHQAMWIRRYVSYHSLLHGQKDHSSHFGHGWVYGYNCIF